MKRICILKNSVQNYAWGSTTAIQELLGQEVDKGKPVAELWLGAHPKAPSMVKLEEGYGSLADIIKQNPEELLGRTVAEKFNNSLPYLFKILAAEKPLSIQAHPSLKQAKEGFKSENMQNIPLNAPDRNYRDENHKPECICALTQFWALNGFRKISDIISLMDKLGVKGMDDELNHLKRSPDSDGLKIFFKSIMSMNLKRSESIVADAAARAEKDTDNNPVFKWIVKLNKEYPADMGVFSPVFLNLILLEPGQAMFLPAGELHAYLKGVGIELMANSDNVLRGGLTPKHVDVPELLKVLNFKEREVEILTPVHISECESFYKSQAEEFILSYISVTDAENYISPEKRSIEILICCSGKALFTEPGREYSLEVSKGLSVVIPSAVARYEIKGKAVFYKASVPV